MPRASQVGNLKLYERLPQFVRENLRDLHEMNIGILHRHPVIIDYAAGLD